MKGQKFKVLSSFRVTALCLWYEETDWCSPQEGEGRSDPTGPEGDMEVPHAPGMEGGRDFGQGWPQAAGHHRTSQGLRSGLSLAVGTS